MAVLTPEDRVEILNLVTVVFMEGLPHQVLILTMMEFLRLVMDQAVWQFMTALQMQALPAS
jgi:hypothetical protein